MYENRAKKRPILALSKKTKTIVEERIVERSTCFDLSYFSFTGPTGHMCLISHVLTGLTVLTCLTCLIWVSCLICLTGLTSLTGLTCLTCLTCLTGLTCLTCLSCLTGHMKRLG
jgi:hypothetical protein